MRPLTLTLAVTAALVIALALLATVSERSAPEVSIGPEMSIGSEAPSAAVHDIRDDPLIACLLARPPAADEAVSAPRGLPCRPGEDHKLRMDVQMTEC